MMLRGIAHLCTCHAWVMFGDAATDEDVAMWEAWHEGCRPVRLVGRYRDGAIVDDAGRPLHELAGDVLGRMVDVTYVVASSEIAKSYAAARLLRVRFEAAGAKRAFVEGLVAEFDPEPERVELRGYFEDGELVDDDTGGPFLLRGDGLGVRGRAVELTYLVELGDVPAAMVKAVEVRAHLFDLGARTVAMTSALVESVVAAREEADVELVAGPTSGHEEAACPST